MIYLVLEDTKFKMNNFVNKLETKFLESSRVTLTKDNCFAKAKSLPKSPLFGGDWYIRVSVDVPLSVFRILNDNNLNAVILLSSGRRQTLEKAVNYFEKVNITNYRFVDCTKITKDNVLEYVLNKLNISNENAVQLCKQARYNPSLIMKNVMLFSSYEIVTLQDVKKFGIKSNPVGLDYILFAMLGYRFKNFNYTGCQKVLHKYKRGYKFLIKTFSQGIEKVIYIFNAIDSGELTTVNYKEFLSNDKYLRGYSPYNLLRVIELRTYTSLEFVYEMLDFVRTRPKDKIAIVFFQDMIRNIQGGK